MSKHLLQIDFINSTPEQDEDDLIKIMLESEDIIQVNFSNLIRKSRYIRDKYKFSEAIDSIQNEIDDVQKRLNIKSESIKLFIQLIQQGTASVPIEHYKDIYILSEYFCIDKFTRELDKIIKEELLTDLDITIQILSESKLVDNDFETKLTSKIENFLSNRFNECIENSKFKKLPISTIFNIIERSHKENINLNSLVDFILESTEARYTLFKFVEFHKLSDEKVDKIFNFISQQSEETKKKYFEHIPFNFSYIIKMRQSYDDLYKEMKQMKEEIKQTKEELGRTQIKLVQTEDELDQYKKDYEQSRQKLEKAENEMKYYTKTIIVGGYDKYNQLGGNPNNKNKDGYPVINPPQIMSFDHSSLLSYSVYGWHSVLVTSDGSLLGTGYNGDHRISSSLPKSCITQFKEFSIKECCSRQLSPISAVCIGCGTLYMFSKGNGNSNSSGNSCGCGRQLVLCNCYINGGNPVFLDIGNQQPVSLFGGYSHAAAITKDGEIIFINNRSVMQSPESRITAVSLPCGEKASCVACCDDSVVVLSSNGRLFSSAVGNGNNALKFSSVSELADEHIISLSGTYKHCLAVSKEGRVFGRGSNESGRLGLGKGSWEVSSFTEISSLSGYEIRAAYAGCGHSLFVTKEGKILSCGTNQYGQLLLSSGPGKEVYLPTETTISGGAAFCIAGDCLSAVFIGSYPPSNTPNMKILQNQ